MSIFSWMASLLQQQQASGSHSIESQTPPDHDESAINPANGLPMIGGMGGVDVEGNELRSRLCSERHIIDGVRLGSGVLVLQKDRAKQPLNLVILPSVVPKRLLKFNV